MTSNQTESQPSPRVLVVRTQLFKASETFIYQQARALRRYVPILVGNALHGPAPADLDARIAPRGALASRMLLGERPMLKLIERLISDERPALIHAHFGVDASVVFPVARMHGIPLVTTFHGFDATVSRAALLLSSRPAWIAYALHRERLAQQGSLFLCVSESIRKRVLALGFPPERTLCHYIGTDLLKFSESRVNPTNDECVILHVARLVEKKGTGHLIDAFAIVKRQHARARLTIIGEGPLKSTLQNQCATLGLTASVDFLGTLPHTEVLRHLRRSAIFALPSITAKNGDSEGLPISLLEAAASSLPIVSTRHSGIPELVCDPDHGALVDEGDVPALAAALAALLDSETLRTRLGKNARRRTHEHFDIVRQTEKLESLYDAVRWAALESLA